MRDAATVAGWFQAADTYSDSSMQALIEKLGYHRNTAEHIKPLQKAQELAIPWYGSYEKWNGGGKLHTLQMTLLAGLAILIVSAFLFYFQHTFATTTFLAGVSIVSVSAFCIVCILLFWPHFQEKQTFIYPNNDTRSYTLPASIHFAIDDLNETWRMHKHRLPSLRVRVETRERTPQFGSLCKGKGVSLYTLYLEDDDGLGNSQAVVPVCTELAHH